jgi:nitroreductase
MNFTEIAQNRQSCRNFDPDRQVEENKLTAILNAATLSPSAVNRQPYFLTVCKGELAKEVAKATTPMGFNKFTLDAPLQIVISEKPPVLPNVGAKMKKSDYRSVDIGILSAYITAEATAQGLGSCIIGWFDEKKLKTLCGIKDTVRLVISIGYAKAEDKLRPKKRKAPKDLYKIL